MSVSDWYLVVKLADQPLALQSILPLGARDRAGRILIGSGLGKVEYFISGAAHCGQTPGVSSGPWGLIEPRGLS